MMNYCENSESAMLREICKVDFAVVEMTLYLDTHPYEKEAMAYLNHYVRLKNQMEKEYSRKYGPLSVALTEGCDNAWIWALAPAPWKGGYK